MNNDFETYNYEDEDENEEKKITKEMVDTFFDSYEKIEQKIYRILVVLSTLYPKKYNTGCSYFQRNAEGTHIEIIYVDYYGETNEYQYIPIEYLYDENWLEKEEEKLRIYQEEEKKQKFLREIKEKEEKEIRDREQYERLKKKFEINK